MSGFQVAVPAILKKHIAKELRALQPQPAAASSKESPPQASSKLKSSVGHVAMISSLRKQSAAQPLPSKEMPAPTTKQSIADTDHNQWLRLWIRDASIQFEQLQNDSGVVRPTKMATLCSTPNATISKSAVAPQTATSKK